MPTKKPTRAQSRKQRRDIKKLRDLGLINKVDLRKKPTRAVKRSLRKFSDVLTGKSQVIKPAKASTYRKVFTVVGDKVIVPKIKGQRWRVDKAGRIKSTKPVGRAKIVSRIVELKRDLSNIDNSKMYAVPFIRGRDTNGVPRLHWQRIPGGELRKFILEYTTKEQSPYKQMHRYVVEDDVSDAALTEILGMRGLATGETFGRYRNYQRTRQGRRRTRKRKSRRKD